MRLRHRTPESYMATKKAQKVRFPKTLHVAEDVHRYLRMEAARTGETVAEVADRHMRDCLTRSGGKLWAESLAATRPPSQSTARRRR